MNHFRCGLIRNWCIMSPSWLPVSLFLLTFAIVTTITVLHCGLLCLEALIHYSGLVSIHVFLAWANVKIVLVCILTEYLKQDIDGPHWYSNKSTQTKPISLPKYVFSPFYGICNILCNGSNIIYLMSKLVWIRFVAPELFKPISIPSFYMYQHSVRIESVKTTSI